MWRLFPGAARTTWEHLLGERDDHKSLWKLVKVYKNAYWYLIRLKKTYTIGAYSKGCCSMMKKLMQNWVSSCSSDSFFWAPMSLRLHLLSCQLHVGNLVSTQLYFTEYSNPSLRECTAKASPNTSIISSHLHPTSTQTKLSVVFSLHCVELSLECKREAVFSSGSLP